MLVELWVLDRLCISDTACTCECGRAAVADRKASLTHMLPLGHKWKCECCEACLLVPLSYYCVLVQFETMERNIYLPVNIREC
ncbi:hypothetical protein PILCRDRAFT_245026 [Piloderma croceum F 1598]|uniref:Uncharacterized protein n=1 Tax=Piloderma croceum (strain F 1598) TaxID=765440 RepID=A0A0C3FXC4_PILCF|nr:hypothetical protein PILCRDRAFT_245026 [Piloderma croceum F 1598]